MTLDGKVTRPDGSWFGLTTKEDRRRMDVYRARADFVLAGRTSVERDNPEFVPKDGSQAPTPVMICRTILPPLDRRIFQQKKNKPILFISDKLAPAGDLTSHAELIALEDSKLTLSNVLHLLHDKGFQKGLLESGPKMNFSFFLEDLVDTLFITLVPFLIGQDGLPNIISGPSAIPGFDERRWELKMMEKSGSEIYLEYERIRRS